MKFWIGMLTGFAAGITVGILYAPARGSVTRRRIAHTASDIADTSREKMHDFTRSTRRKARQVSQATSDKVHQAYGFASEKVDDVGRAVENITERLQRMTA